MDDDKFPDDMPDEEEIERRFMDEYRRRRQESQSWREFLILASIGVAIAFALIHFGWV